MAAEGQPDVLSRVTGQLHRAADLLEAFGENPYRVRAYRNGILALQANASRFHQRLADGTLTALPGIGPELAAKIDEIARTGSLSALTELEARVPPEAATLMAVPGVSQKLAIYLAVRLHVHTVAHLKKFAATHMLRAIPWLGAEGELAVQHGLGVWAERRAHPGEYSENHPSAFEAGGAG